MNGSSQPQNVYIGSYSDGQRRPSFYDLIPKQMTALKINIDLINPSYVLPFKNVIYIVEQKNNGQLVTIDKDFNVLQTMETRGNDPCHIAINNAGTKLVVTNYSSGSFIMYGLDENGVPSKVLSFVMHEGHGKNPDRQEGPHPHCSLFSETDHVLFVTDLGTDTVYYYSVSPNQSEGLVCVKEKCLKMEGCGPRHIIRAPGHQILFMTGELDSSVRVISYQNGKLQLVSAYKVSQNPSNYPSELKYFKGNLFVANRGDNYLIVFNIVEETKLAQKFRFKVGEWPRHFNISKAGTIYVACQYENIVQRYRWEGEKVFQLGSLKISCASCVNFVQ